MDWSDDIAARLSRLGVREEDLDEEFIRGSGAGGQKINKTSSTVRLRHVPSGIEVRCQDERSLTRNREIARQRLCEALEARASAARLAAQQEKEKTRRQNRPKPRAIKRRQVDSKRHRQRIKSNRRRTSDD